MIDKKIRLVEHEGIEIIDSDHFIKLTKVIYRAKECRLDSLRAHFYDQRASSFRNKDWKNYEKCVKY